MKRGFTLIELLVVIAIIAILAAILFPVFAKAREKARQTTCISNSQQIAVDILIWAQDHDETLPAAAQIWTQTKTDPGILVCPTRGKTVGNAYGYNSFVGEAALGDIDAPDQTVLTADWNDRGPNAAASPNIITGKDDIAKRHSGGAIFSYVDGHVAWSKFTVDDAPTRSLDENDPNTVYLAPVTPGNCVATPTFSVYSGTLPQVITISCTTSGATIRYTTGGSVPTSATATIVPSGGTVTINASPTPIILKAKAFKTGMNESGVATGNYTGSGGGNTAPSAIAITDPASPQTAGTIIFGGTCTDDAGLAALNPIKIYTDPGCGAGTELGGSSTSAGMATSFTWHYTVTLAAGAYTLYAKATDAGTLTSAASVVYNFTVNPAATNTPSTATKFIPSAFTAVQGNAVYMTCTAQDTEGVYSVQFQYYNGAIWQNVGSLLTNPAATATSWDTLLALWPTAGVTPGAYQFRAEVADNSTGNPVTDCAAFATTVTIIAPGGTLYAWGWNGSGQVGDGSGSDQHSPVAVSTTSGLNSVSAISAGNQHSLALKSDGTVWAWGSDNNGELGNGVYVSGQPTPLMVLTSKLSGVVAIAAGYEHSLTLKSDGTVWAFGNDNYGEMGDGAAVHQQQYDPVQVSQSTGLTGVVAISGGQDFSLALKNDGTVWAWGRNNYGQLGNGTTTDTNVPGQVSSLSGVMFIAAGGEFALALKRDGTVWAWGWNSSGQVGNGTTTDQHTPVQVLTDTLAISAGWYHAMAIKSDLSVWVWGKNSDYGELGDGTANNALSPEAVPNLSGEEFKAISAGGNHCLAVRASDGVVIAWGWNLYGQLGVGSSGGYRNTPAPVNTLTGMTAIAGGGEHNLAF